jgi:hypothetical protein
LVTTADGQQAAASGLAATPVGTQKGALAFCNGVQLDVGNGVKTRECYFSGDGGATARTFPALQAGDFLYWNGSIAGYQIAASDVFAFAFNVT